ncbi:PspC domain-containing protein [Telluribacter sp. SYSU D00476]|uniref:PspC domain-containing protein n=1 Tax=Telluribacter sp. SYSU D00476 TaxID=2811430 RepID=UPI001FF65BA0|nr:PspC domain-containing protein [Telluribacter sp. SYSU D00476]
MNNNRLFRNMNQKVIGGVASGLAEYFGVDVAIIRVLFIVAFFIPLPFPVVIAYIAFWIAMPAKPIIHTATTAGGGL